MTIRTVLTFIATCVAIILTFSDGAFAQSLNGNWQIESGTMHGRTIPASAFDSMALTFNNNQFSAVSGNLSSTGTVLAHPQAAIKQLEFTINSGADSGRNLKAIYRFENGGLEITYGQSNDFPTTFDATAENKQLTLRYRAGGPGANGGVIGGNQNNNIAQRNNNNATNNNTRSGGRAPNLMSGGSNANDGTQVTTQPSGNNKGGAGGGFAK